MRPPRRWLAGVHTVTQRLGSMSRPRCRTRSWRDLVRRERTSSVALRPADDCGGIDLDQPFGPRERLDDQTRGDGIDALEPAAHHPVNRFAVTDVGEVDSDLDDVAQRATR